MGNLQRLTVFLKMAEKDASCNFEGCPLKKSFQNLKNNPAIGFFTAIQTEQLELVQHCLENHQDICQPETTDEFNWTALKTAEKTENQEIINLLLKVQKSVSTEESSPEQQKSTQYVPFCKAFCKPDFWINTKLSNKSSDNTRYRRGSLILVKHEAPKINIKNGIFRRRNSTGLNSRQLSMMMQDF